MKLQILITEIHSKEKINLLRIKYWAKLHQRQTLTKVKILFHNFLIQHYLLWKMSLTCFNRIWKTTKLKLKFQLIKQSLIKIKFHSKISFLSQREFNLKSLTFGNFRLWFMIITMDKLSLQWLVSKDYFHKIILQFSNW